MLAGRFHLAVLLLALFIACNPSSAADRAVDVSPKPNVDENMFVLRAIARQYNRWPHDTWDGTAALKFCEEGRLEIKYLRSIAQRDHLDGAISGMCDDFLTLIDEYETTLDQIGKINDNARRQAVDDALKTFVIGATKSLKAAADADAEGKSKLQVDAAAAKTLVDDGLKVYIDHSKARDAQTNNSVAAEQDRFSKVLAYAMERNHTAAQGLTDRLHWAAGEAGFDSTPIEPLSDLVKRRPRDPFAMLQLASTGVTEETPINDLINRARWCVLAARQIPADQAFAGYREECMRLATQFACNAAEGDIGRTYTDAPTAHSQEAINITRAMEKMDPQDQDGWVHVELFRALASAGRFDEALQAAKPVLNSRWNQSPPFTITYARIAGITGDVAECEKWLRQSYKLGYADVNFVKESPDFEVIQKQKPAAWAELTTPQGSTYIDFGAFNDDVIVKNRSPFPLTKLKMKFTVIQGGKIWKEERELPFVAADSEETLSNVFHIPGSKYDHYRWTLESAQGDLASKDE